LSKFLKIEKNEVKTSEALQCILRVKAIAQPSEISMHVCVYMRVHYHIYIYIYMRVYLMCIHLYKSVTYAGHLGWFYSFAILNRATVNMAIQISLLWIDYTLSDICPRVAWQVIS
jgi:hypothetical protein